MENLIQSVVQRGDKYFGNHLASKEDLVDEILPRYLHTALWSSSQENMEPLDRKYGTDSFTKQAREYARDCVAQFVETVGLAIIDEILNGDESYPCLGHDLWLTQAGHGAGFWDGDWPRPLGSYLTTAAESLGEVHIYECGNNQHITMGI